jgi:pterin-4a-carbinolamine dehydratase
MPTPAPVVPCTDTPPLRQRPTPIPYAELLARFGDPLGLWVCVQHNGAPAIQRTLACPDNSLLAAAQLARQLSRYADGVHHHPRIQLDCGACTVLFQTHDPLGLTQLDAEGALWTQQIYQAYLSGVEEKLH